VAGSHADSNRHWPRTLCDRNGLLPLSGEPGWKKLPAQAEQAICLRLKILSTPRKRPGCHYKLAIKQTSHTGQSSSATKPQPGCLAADLQDEFAGAAVDCIHLDDRTQPDVPDDLKPAALRFKPGGIIVEEPLIARWRAITTSWAKAQPGNRVSLPSSGRPVFIGSLPLR